MKTLEKTDSGVVYRQLAQLVHGGEDADTIVHRETIEIDDHPLLKTGNLIGSVAVRVCRGKFSLVHLEIMHKALIEAKAKVISRSSIYISSSGDVALQLRPMAERNLLIGYMDALLYAKGTYLPARIIEKFEDRKGASQIVEQSELGKLPELVYLIAQTGEYRRATN